MHTGPALVLVIRVPGEANLEEHVYAVSFCSRIDKRQIERIAVIGRQDGRTRFADVLKPAPDEGRFIRLIEDSEGAFIFRFRSIVKVCDIFANYVTIGDKEALAINHV